MVSDGKLAGLLLLALPLGLLSVARGGGFRALVGGLVLLAVRWHWLPVYGAAGWRAWVLPVLTLVLVHASDWPARPNCNCVGLPDSLTHAVFRGQAPLKGLKGGVEVLVPAQAFQGVHGSSFGALLASGTMT